MTRVFETEYSFSDQEKPVNEFLQQPACPKVRLQKPVMIVDNPLIALYPDVGSSTAYIGQLFNDPEQEVEVNSSDALENASGQSENQEESKE